MCRFFWLKRRFNKQKTFQYCIFRSRVNVNEHAIQKIRSYSSCGVSLEKETFYRVSWSIHYTVHSTLSLAACCAGVR